MKLNFFPSVIDYFRGVVSESKKITFPSRQQSIHDSLVVIAAIIFGALFLALLDFLVVSLWQKIII